MVNIDSFRDTISVGIKGQTYDLQTATVKETIEQTVEQNLDRTSTSKFMESAMAVITERSSIPKDVIETLTFDQIDALLLALQGIESVGI